MELAKKPIRFLFNGDSESFRISIPGTEHHYRFWKNQPYLVKFDLDIKFFDGHLMFDRVDSKYESAEEVVKSVDEVEEEPQLTKEEYKKALENMSKSTVRKILKEVDPEKKCPVKKENIIKAILEAQY